MQKDNPSIITLSLSTLATVCNDSLAAQSSIKTTAKKTANLLAFDLVGATIAELNNTVKPLKAAMSKPVGKYFDQLIRECILPVLAQENKKPFFFYNKETGKAGSMALFHTQPQTLKGKANPKQLTATGKAPMPSTSDSVSVEQLANALPSLSPIERIKNEVLQGAITLKELESLSVECAAILLARTMRVTASTGERKAAIDKQSHKPLHNGHAVAAAQMADAMRKAQEKKDKKAAKKPA